MPTYCYRLVDNGELIEKTMTIAEMEALPRDGEGLVQFDEGLAMRSIEDEHKSVAPPSNWPMYCDAAGVHPKQIREHQDHLKARGVNTDYLPDGRAIFRDAAHRKAHCKVLGFHDRNGGYGDP